MKQTQAPGFFPVFLFSFMAAVELAVVLMLAGLGVLPRAALALLSGVLALVTLLLWRVLFSRKSKALLRALVCLLMLCNTAACLGGAFTALLVENTVETVFGGSLPTPSYAPQNPTQEPFVVYLGGSDSRSGKLTKSRNDVNILAVVNPNTNQVLLVNTPRDYYVKNPAGKGAKDKLTHLGLYGMDNCKQGLGALYDVPVAYGALINFKGFETLVDAMGGITVTSDVAFITTEGGYTIRAGENLLDGAKALAFARERQHLAGGDNARGQNQMKVLQAMGQALTRGNVLRKYKDVLAGLEGMFVTDMPLGTIARLAMGELGNLEEWEIHSVAVTGTGGTAHNYSAGGKAYVMYPDADSVAHAKTMIEQVMAGAYLE